MDHPGENTHGHGEKGSSDILLNAFHERYSPFEKCAVKFSTVARIVRAESVAGKIYCESIIVKRIW